MYNVTTNDADLGFACHSGLSAEDERLTDAVATSDGRVYVTSLGSGDWWPWSGEPTRLMSAGRPVSIAVDTDDDRVFAS